MNHVNAAQNTAQNHKPQGKRHKRKLTPAELADLKSRSQCVSALSMDTG